MTAWGNASPSFDLREARYSLERSTFSRFCERLEALVIIAPCVFACMNPLLPLNPLHDSALSCNVRCVYLALSSDKKRCISDQNRDVLVADVGAFYAFCAFETDCFVGVVWSSWAMLLTGKFLEGSTTITNGFTHAISTGNWVLKRFKVDRQGVTQVKNKYFSRLVFKMLLAISATTEETVSRVLVPGILVCLSSQSLVPCFSK